LGLSLAFFALFLCVSGYLFFRSNGGGERGGGASAIFSGNGAVGIVELSGVIMDSRKVIKRLRSFEDNAEIKAVVLRLNSPGGAVAPSQEIYQAVKDFKKPLVVSMSSIAASGAFYVAMGSKKVYANPGTITGSIGVIMEFADLEKLYDWAKVKRYSIKTGHFKDIGAEYREMEPDERELLQGMVDDVLIQFKKAIAVGRKLSLEQVTQIADGRVFSGAQAKAQNLVDELGTFQDAIDEAAKEGDIKGKPVVLYPDSGKRKWLDLLMDDSRGDDSSDSESRVNLSGLSPLGRMVSALFGGSTPGAGVTGSLTQAITGLEPGIYWLWTGSK
jgi:protease IV